MHKRGAFRASACAAQDQASQHHLSKNNFHYAVFTAPICRCKSLQGPRRDWHSVLNSHVAWHSYPFRYADPQRWLSKSFTPRLAIPAGHGNRCDGSKKRCFFSKSSCARLSRNTLRQDVGAAVGFLFNTWLPLRRISARVARSSCSHIDFSLTSFILPMLLRRFYPSVWRIIWPPRQRGSATHLASAIR